CFIRLPALEQTSSFVQRSTRRIGLLRRRIRNIRTRRQRDRCHENDCQTNANYSRLRKTHFISFRTFLIKVQASLMNQIKRRHQSRTRRGGHHHQRRLRIVFRQSNPAGGGVLLARRLCFSKLLRLVGLERLLQLLLDCCPHFFVRLHRTFGV